MSEFSKGYEAKRRVDKTFHDPLFSSPLWVYSSIFISWLIDLLPISDSPFFPDFLGMTLIFWSIYQPEKIYYWLVFLIGLLVDTDSSAVFGQNSLSLCVMVFCAEAMSQRLQWLQRVGQAINILPVLLVPAVLLTIESFCFGSFRIQWDWVTKALVGVALWPAWCFVLCKKFINYKS